MLLERDREVELLAGLLTGVGSSGGKVVLVRGEAGVGKTSLVKQFVERHTDEAHVLSGFCDDLTTPQPLGPFYDIARTEPAVNQALIDGDRPALFEALLELLSRSLRPTVLVIEDTQWAYEATLDAIRYLGRRISTTSGLLLLTYRDEEVDYDHPLRSVMGAIAPSDITRIRLDCLTAEAVETMLEGESADLDSIMRLTDGNPLFVTEILTSEEDHIPLSVRDSVITRTARLSPPVQELLNALSVIPQRISLSEARQLATGADVEFQECVRSGLLVTDDETVSFRHELIRRAIEEALTGDERQAANRAALKMLSDETDPARLVHHARAAGDVDRLIELAPRAAEAAAEVGSHLEAVAHYLTLEPHLDRLDAAAKGKILDSWGREQTALSPFSESIRVQQLRIDHHRENGNRSAESAALADAGFAQITVLRRGAAERLARQAIDILGPDAAGPDLVPAFDLNCYMAMMRSDFVATREWADRALEAAGPDADETLVIRCLNHRGVADSSENYPDGRASFDEAARRAEAIGNWREASRALHNFSFMAADHFDPSTALDYAQRAVAAASREDVPGRLSYSMLMQAKALDLAGDWNEAEVIAEDTPATPVVFQTVALQILGVIEARRGKPGARTTLSPAWELANEADQHMRRAPAAAALAEYAWICGDTGLSMQDVTATMHTGLGITPGWARSEGAIALWLWKLGELDEAPEGIAEPYRLIIGGQPLEAAEQWAELGCPYEEAIALSHGPPDAQLQALEKLDTLEATAVAAKLRQQLRDQGVKVPRGKAQSTRQHAVGLTARQAEVLALLAEGLTNPEIADRLFVSPRTVEHHVSAVLSKFDATTRQDAVTQAHQQGLVSDATQ